MPKETIIKLGENLDENDNNKLPAPLQQEKSHDVNNVTEFDILPSEVLFIIINFDGKDNHARLINKSFKYAFDQPLTKQPPRTSIINFDTFRNNFIVKKHGKIFIYDGGKQDNIKIQKDPFEKDLKKNPLKIIELNIPFKSIKNITNFDNHNFSKFDNHIVIETIDGKHLVYGRNNYGQRGLGHDYDVDTFTEFNIPGVPGENIKKLKINNSFNALAETIDGKFFVCGSNHYKQLWRAESFLITDTSEYLCTPIEFRISILDLIDKSIAEFIYLGDYSIVKTTNNKFYGCGSNSDGQLGVEHINSGNYRNVYIPKELTIPREKIKNFTCDVYHIAIEIETKADDNFFVCGSNENGQLGLGHNNRVDTFEKLKIKGQKIKKIIFKNPYTIIETFDLKTKNEKSFVTGETHRTYDEFGKISDSINTCTPIELLAPEGEEISAITYGPRIIIKTKSGKFFIFKGKGVDGLEEIKIEGQDIQNITCIKYFAISSPTPTILLAETIDKITKEKKYFVHGSNVFGQLGQGHNEYISTYQEFKIPGNKKISKITCNNLGTTLLAETTDNEFWICGINNFVEHTDKVYTPTLLEGFSTIATINIDAKLIEIKEILKTKYKLSGTYDECKDTDSYKTLEKSLNAYQRYTLKKIIDLTQDKIKDHTYIEKINLLYRALYQKLLKRNGILTHGNLISCLNEYEAKNPLVISYLLDKAKALNITEVKTESKEEVKRQPEDNQDNKDITQEQQQQPEPTKILSDTDKDSPAPSHKPNDDNEKDHSNNTKKKKSFLFSLCSCRY